MKDKSLSIIIPCYNEAENLEKLIEIIKSELNKLSYKIEVILINNGSTDNTQEILNKLLKNNQAISYFNIDKNIGYGNGILLGLSKAKNEFLGWTHADLQCDFKDCLKAFEILYRNTNESNLNFLIKGKRINRKFTDNLFTKLMSIFIKIFCRVHLEDINAQPKLFSRKFYSLFNNPPRDFLLDFYLLHLSSIHNYKILDLDVDFSERKYGKAKGGGSLLGKVILSIKTAYYVVKYHNGNNYSQNK